MEKYPENYALSVDGVDWRYSDLMTRSGNICNTICDHRRENSGMVAIFGHRTVDTYAGVLGILWSGNGYVPLNPKFPIDRTAYMLDSSGASTVVVDAPHFEQLLTVLERTNSVETIILASEIAVDITGPKSGRYNIDPAVTLLCRWNLLLHFLSFLPLLKPVKAILHIFYLRLEAPGSRKALELRTEIVTRMSLILLTVIRPVPMMLFHKCLI
jgi:acyl-CoA synthetase (AMP-forming)/AMP-acid ligase II